MTMNYMKQIRDYVPVCKQERMDKETILHFIEDHNHNVLLRDNTIAHLTASGFIVDPTFTKVLFIYHKVYQSWGWTGGHMDGDPDLLTVALKEASEETGLKNLRPLSKNLMSLDILPVWGHMKKKAYISAHLHLNGTFILIGDPDEPLVMNEEETEGLQWIDVDVMERYSNEPYMVTVYKKLIKAAKAYKPEPDAKEPLETVAKTDKGFLNKVTEAAVPIAILEAKSAYYKLKLVKEVGEGLLTESQKLLKKRHKKKKE